jgi:hypothetical protein
MHGDTPDSADRSGLPIHSLQFLTSIISFWQQKQLDDGK